jgi:hypothetical protein
VRTVTELLAPIDPDHFRPIDGHNQFASLKEWLAECRDSDRGLLCFYH